MSGCQENEICFLDIYLMTHTEIAFLGEIGIMLDPDSVKEIPKTPQKKAKKRDALDDTTINAGLAGAQSEITQRYGAANKQHLVAYSGTDHESGQQLSKSLKGIAKGRINPEHKEANINQQGGYDAEVKTVAIEEAEKIISGNKNTKVTRTDDIAKQPDGKGNIIGGKNDQLYDIAEVDKNGIYIEGTARQLKFVGGTPQQCADNLLIPKYDKYRDADVPIEVPSDFYDGVKKELEKKAEEIKKQLAAVEKKGDAELVAKKKAELDRVEKTNKNLKKGKLTKEEAIEARLHPKLSTAKDVAKISHRAGCEAAKIGAMIGGGISFIRNSVAVIKGDQTPGNAAFEVTKDTVGAAALSYATGFFGSALKGAMQNAPSKYVRSLSKTNLPGTVLTVMFETGKTLKRYAEDEIDGTECLTELGEKGTGMLASAMGATIGQVVIPIPILGGLVGGMIGYSMSSAYYNSLVNALNEAKLAHEERLRIEAECHEAIIAIKEYRMEIELVIANYLQQHVQVFNEAFIDMENAYNTGDVDKFIGGANRITEQLGGKPPFVSKTQFDELMNNQTTIRI